MSKIVVDKTVLTPQTL